MNFIQKILLFLLLWGNFGLAQSNYSLQKHSKALDTLSKIEKDQKKYEKVTLSNEDLPFPTTDGGSELTGYYSKGEIKKIEFWVGISYGISITNFYFTNNQLFLVKETFDGFIFDEDNLSLDYSQTERNFTGYYYFSNNHLVDYETTGHNRFEDDSLDPEKILIEEMTEYLNLLNGKL